MKTLFVPTRVVPLVAACCVVILPGCSQPASRQTDPEINTVRYVTASEFSELLSDSSKTLLAEFSVPVGCFRCDQMSPQLESLAKQLDGRVEVCRVNLNYERELTNKLGVTVCPTYIAFVDGQESFRMTYPTSGDLLMARLEASTGQP